MNARELMQPIENSLSDMWQAMAELGLMELAAVASVDGAENCTPAMLPDIWTKEFCPYRTPLYREAWYRGLYSQAAWYLLDLLAQTLETTKPDYGMLLSSWVRNHPGCGWEVVEEKDGED